MKQKNMNFKTWLLLVVMLFGSITGEIKVIRKNITEEAMMGTILLDLKKELDFDPKYGFKIFPNSSIFTFNDATGVVRSSSALDREELCPSEPECILKYRIIRKTPFTSINLEFEMQDINDNQPFFPKSYMKTTISESTPPGKFFLLHLAEDKDSPAYGVVDYYLEKSQNSENLKKFHLEVEKNNNDQINDVWLHTTEPLDREEKSTYSLKINAIDGGNKTGSATVEVNVLDLNDNKPRFMSDNNEVSVSENTPPGNSLISITASDLDEGNNALIHYTFTDKTVNQFGKFFEINKTTGVIKLLKRLDYEKVTSIPLEVIATDQGIDPLSSTKTVIINVENINDNEPKITFEENKERIELSEDTPLKSKVVNLMVSDEDSDNDIQCSLSVDKSKREPFSLRKESLDEYKIITSAFLDREIDKEHLLVITCIDSEHPRHTSHAKFLVKVLDINDNSPKFKLPLYNISIPENNKPFQKMNHNIEALDDDEGVNGMVAYSIHSHPEGIFQIDEKSGEIWTRVPLDREKNSFYKFSVIAVDGNEQSKERKSSRTVVSVSVLDVNDERPKFRQPVYNFTVPENRHGKYNIGQVTAIDLDLKSRKSFSLEPKTHGSLRFFKIDSKNGMIFATRKLDREERAMHVLKVRVRDDQKPLLNDTAIVNVKVKDENDNPPIIYFPISGNDTAYVSHNAAADQYVTTILAGDLDEGNNSKLSYTISQSSHPNLFRMNSDNGQIFLNSHLPPDESAFSIVVLVKDNGSPPKMTVATLEIFVDSLSAAHSQARPITVQRILTEAHLAIVVGVAAGCLLIILVLICVVCSVTHKETKKASKEVSPPIDNNYDLFNANIKYNPCNVENRSDDITCNDKHSQLRESLILGEIPESSESIVLANLNRDLNLVSSTNNEKKVSRLYCSDVEIDPEKCFGHNIGDMLNTTIMPEESAVDKFNTLHPYRDAMYNSSNYDPSSTLPAPTSPDWLMKALNQRKQSFSRWLNCEGSNLPLNPHSVHEYSTIPSSNRLNSHKFNDDPLLVSQVMIDKKPLEMLPEPPYPAVLKNSVKSSPTYVGLYNRPFANAHGTNHEDDLALNSMQTYSMFQNLVPKTTNAIL